MKVCFLTHERSTIERWLDSIRRPMHSIRLPRVSGLEGDGVVYMHLGDLRPQNP